ncbi:XRE family transcriptional regulator [Oscillospiraceae bacterium MB08-C2-2]|nr:XRE family transcriptional regulator [Oscillospiraceae bacterium MB08-C2-2]
MSAVGAKIKKIRKQRKMTLQDLANFTGLSVGYLSNLERDLTNPTLINLQQICDALQVNVVDIISQTSGETVVRRDQRQELFVPNSSIRYQLLTAGRHSMRGMSVIIDADNSDEEILWGHFEDEMLIVQKGSLEIEFGGEQYILEEGDCAYIAPNTPHKIRKHGAGECTFLWVISDPKAYSLEESAYQLVTK